MVDESKKVSNDRELDRIWVLTAPVAGHCLLFTFLRHTCGGKK